MLQATLTEPGGLGRPSSVAVPTSDAGAGSDTVWSEPAFTVGAVLTGGDTVTTMSSEVDNTLSFAVRRRTYVPAAEKVAVVSTAAALPKLTVPVPLTLLQVWVTVLGGNGIPSSL